MDMEMYVDQMEKDFMSLAEEHEGAADNELIWALGAPTAAQTKMHTENAVQHRELAKLYRAMSEKVSLAVALMELVSW